MVQVEESLYEPQDEMPLPVTDPDYEAWFRRKVEAGELAYREGSFVSQEEATHRAFLRREKLLGRVKG